ncbi:hypothetical protein ON010_g13621 [Phytophthora cinnamomi]|nr:hypothetical protein ON010_g13621 [Phytophthora cinnamomi]
MTIAYFAMLVVMTYETGLFVALICGFGAGFLLFKNLDKDITEERGSWRFTDASTVRIQVEGMSCMKNCGTTVENALKNTPGVTDAVVEFDERAAYVSGSAQYSDLVAAIEAVGFTAEVNNQTGRNSISPRAAILTFDRMVCLNAMAVVNAARTSEGILHRVWTGKESLQKDGGNGWPAK